MSYSKEEARWERNLAIDEATIKKDSKKLKELADLEAEEGDLELATTLKKLAELYQDVQVAPGIYQSKEDYEGNMAFDEHRDNQN